LLDIEAALAARRYAIAGELVLDVQDDAPAADIDVSGRYRLHADDDDVQCARTSRPADLELGQRALASMYLGGVRPSELLVSGAVTELTLGSTRARAAHVLHPALTLERDRLLAGPRASDVPRRLAM
jgi:predicted acetyltransferase